MPERNEPVSRRDFALRAAASASVPLLAGGAASSLADDKKEPQSEPIRPPHELFLDLLRQKFPHKKLDDETLELLRADIAGDLGRYRALEKYPLHNSDEPGFVFAAWRAD